MAAAIANLPGSRRPGMTLDGRVREITNGRFVEAKPEERWFAVRLLWSDLAGRFGSTTACRVLVFDVAQLTFRLAVRQALDEVLTTIANNQIICA